MTFRTFISRLRADKRAVALTEFAMATPLVLTAGLWGLETGNLAITHMRVSQAAMHIADNASRIGDTSSLSNQKIYEYDINDLLRGSDIQAGEAIDLYEYGRVYVSSLQVEPGSANDQQYIAWQRCKGKRHGQSTYGEQDTGKGDPSFKGMGPAGQEVIALESDATMFVEVQYEYQPIVTDAFISERTITTFASFQVRGSRDLSEIHQKDSTAPDDIARCDIFDSYKEEAPPPRAAGGWDWIFSDNPDVGTTSSGGSSSGSSGGSSSSSSSTSSTSSSSGGGETGGSNSGGEGGSGDGGDNDWSLCDPFPWLPWCGDSSGDGDQGDGNNDGGDNDGQWCHTTKKDGYHCHDD